MAAAARAARGDLDPCPRCKESLRSYFHADARGRSGTLWVWCGGCSTYHHEPAATMPRPPSDPFARLSTQELAKLEDDGEVFLDRLERMWTAGTLPGPSGDGSN